MKINRIIIAIVAASMAAACVDPNPQIDFGVDTDNINIGPAGGIRKINVSSSGNWVACSTTLRNIEAVLQCGGVELFDIQVFDIEVHTSAVDALVDYRIEHKGVVGAGRYGNSYGLIHCSGLPPKSASLPCGHQNGQATSLRGIQGRRLQTSQDPEVPGS